MRHLGIHLPVNFKYYLSHLFGFVAQTDFSAPQTQFRAKSRQCDRLRAAKLAEAIEQRDPYSPKRLKRCKAEWD